MVMKMINKLFNKLTKLMLIYKKFKNKKFKYKNKSIYSNKTFKD